MVLGLGVIRVVNTILRTSRTCSTESRVEGLTEIRYNRNNDIKVTNNDNINVSHHKMQVFFLCSKGPSASGPRRCPGRAREPRQAEA